MFTIKNMRDIVAGDKYVISSEGLIVKDIRDPEDAGTYTCHAEVTAQGTMDEQTIEVEVHSEYFMVHDADFLQLSITVLCVSSNICVVVQLRHR